MGHVLVFGEALIDFVPEQTGVALKNVTHFERCAGGAPANVAACIATLGGNASFLGQVGHDAFGQHIADILSERGVHTRLLRYSPDYSTAMAFVTLDENGERDFVFVRHETADLRIGSIGLVDDVRDASVFHFGSNLFMDDEGLEVTRQCIQQAKQSGMLLSYDPNLRPVLWPNETVDSDLIRSFFSDVDILKVSEEEAAMLTEMRAQPFDVFEAAEQLAENDIQLVIITRGKDGCVYRFQDINNNVHTGAVSGYLIDAVDTTGAGDAFMGGFLFRSVDAIRDGKWHGTEAELNENLAFANAVGACCATVKGGINGMPERAAVQRMMG